jgi:hypothetical protein
MTYLNHITLDTGHNRRSPRSEVSDEAIAMVGAHLRRAIAAGSDPIPTRPYDLMATAVGRYLICTIMDGSMPALTFGVAPRARGAKKLWDVLVANRGYPVDTAQPPGAPWLATRIERADLTRKIATWAADYERICAWAWIERATAG